MRSLHECGWLALDGFKTWSDALHVARQMRGRFFGVKVHALEYGQASPWRIIADIQDLGYQCWIDDKQNDIPTTVANVVRGLARGGADLVSVHAGDSTETIAAAVVAYREVRVEECIRPIPGLGIAVISVLTSTPSSTAHLVYSKSLKERALEAAKWASVAGAYGVVCSPQEVGDLCANYPGVKYLTPGIRLPGSPRNDQERVDTPSHAISRGANFLVIGREVTEAEDRLGAVERIEENLAGGSD